MTEINLKMMFALWCRIYFVLLNHVWYQLEFY